MTTTQPTAPAPDPAATCELPSGPGEEPAIADAFATWIVDAYQLDGQTARTVAAKAAEMFVILPEPEKSKSCPRCTFRREWDYSVHEGRHNKVPDGLPNRQGEWFNEKGQRVVVYYASNALQLYACLIHDGKREVLYDRDLGPVETLHPGHWSPAGSRERELAEANRELVAENHALTTHLEAVSRERDSLRKYDEELTRCERVLERWPLASGCNGHLCVAGHLSNILDALATAERERDAADERCERLEGAYQAQEETSRET